METTIRNYSRNILKIIDYTLSYQEIVSSFFLFCLTAEHLIHLILTVHSYYACFQATL